MGASHALVASPSRLKAHTTPGDVTHPLGQKLIDATIGPRDGREPGCQLLAPGRNSIADCLKQSNTSPVERCPDPTGGPPIGLMTSDLATRARLLAAHHLSDPTAVGARAGCGGDRPDCRGAPRSDTSGEIVAAASCTMRAMRWSSARQGSTRVDGAAVCGAVGASRPRHVVDRLPHLCRLRGSTARGSRHHPARTALTRRPV